MRESINIFFFKLIFTNCQKTIGDLNSEFQDLQSKVLPKKKFGFKVKDFKGLLTKSDREPRGSFKEIKQ